jgi:hypothetical protein
MKLKLDTGEKREAEGAVSDVRMDVDLIPNIKVKAQEQGRSRPGPAKRKVQVWARSIQLDRACFDFRTFFSLFFTGGSQAWALLEKGKK